MSSQKPIALQDRLTAVADRESRLSRRGDIHPTDAFAMATAPIRRLGTIVVPLDGTFHAEHALPLAISLARRSGGILKLVRAFLPTPRPLGHRQWDAFDIMEDRARIDAVHYLDQVQKRISTRNPDVKVTGQLISATEIVDGILQGAQTADLLVMATRGRGWLARVVLGSVSRDLLRHHEGPMIFVRGDDTAVDLSADSTPSHLSVALDGIDELDQTFKMAGTLAQLSNARSSLIHSYDPRDSRMHAGSPSPGTYLDDQRQTFTKYAPDVQAYLAGEAASATEGLISFMNDFETDLLVTAMRGTRAKELRDKFNLIRRSRVPVLVVREPARRNHVTRETALNDELER